MRFAALILATFLWCLRSLAAFAADSSSSVEVYVWGQQPTSAATEQTRWDKDLELRPSNTPSDVLRVTPGLIIGQHHGGGKADQILFRGFDSDHGTDFAVFIDGIPVDMVSHGHGQGYADVHWLIPETIERVEIYKGPYFVHLGDFATSGAMNIITQRRDKDSTITLSGGSYNTQRHVGRRYSIEDGSILTPTSTVLDLFLKYVWQRYEFFVQCQNLASRKWRAAEHAFESRLPGEPTAGVLDSHFTPGDPFTVKAGVTVHLW